MRLLLDTQVVLWWREASGRLSPGAYDVIAGAEMVYVSAASAWEVAIKRALGKLRLPAALSAGVDASGFARLPIEFEHAELAGSLPRHHGDPFDRLIIAQAQLERLPIMTADPHFRMYDVEVLAA
jgi:PIN domain nuclease of toxin-antitoxin system